jgi:hypothetical protein
MARRGRKGAVSSRLHAHRMMLVAQGKASYWMPYRPISEMRWKE